MIFHFSASKEYAALVTSSRYEYPLAVAVMYAMIQGVLSSEL